MNNEAVIREVLPKNGPKRLARLMGVPVETARGWMYRRLSVSRTRELALALLAHMDAEDHQRAVNRERLLTMAGEDGGRTSSTDGVLDGGGDVVDRGAAGSTPAREVGRATGTDARVLAALKGRR